LHAIQLLKRLAALDWGRRKPFVPARVGPIRFQIIVEHPQARPGRFERLLEQLLAGHGPVGHFCQPALVFVQSFRQRCNEVRAQEHDHCLQKDATEHVERVVRQVEGLPAFFLEVRK